MNAVIKAINDYYRIELSEKLKEIDSRLGVNVNMSTIVRAQDKLFSLTKNILKMIVMHFILL